MQPKPVRLQGWRRLASALWSEPNDPQIYGSLAIDASALLAFIEQARVAGRHVTPTHLVGRAVARALALVPALNVRLAGDRAIPRDGVDIFFIAAIGAAGAQDLSGVKVKRVDERDVFSVARELDERAKQLREGADPQLSRAKRSLDRLPRPLLRWALRAGAWAVGERAWNLPLLGLEASPFGSAMVSSVGMLGLPSGFAPIAWLYRVPALVLAGEIEDQPRAIAGRVEVRPILPLTFSIDHRYVDAAQLGQALGALQAYLAAPASFEPPP
ncbi:MAG TPA: 2-oxo acid dehydrogenase subunit E2 [Polyangiaceae bacterium]|nr:2-oxo acid dehydrogenase subunit E2 [Polyangiaceae bacterium]